MSHLTHFSHSGSLHGQKDSFFTYFWVILSVYWPTMALMSQMTHLGFSVKHMRHLLRSRRFMVFFVLFTLVFVSYIFPDREKLASRARIRCRHQDTWEADVTICAESPQVEPFDAFFSPTCAWSSIGKLTLPSLYLLPNDTIMLSIRAWIPTSQKKKKKKKSHNPRPTHTGFFKIHRLHFGFTRSQWFNP